MARYPNATPDELKEAHAYAYGGAVIQDMGYYPFGSKFFSDLVHYVRSGDFVEALLRDSKNIDDYAFALGALSHYVSDNDGHRIATNHSVPILYPKLREKYGPIVTYDENPAAHLKTEFGFDVEQVARGNYASEDYHNYIGFEVSKPLLQQAFDETYCIPLDSIFTNYDLALGTYRVGVSSAIPQMTKVAWQLKKDDIQKNEPGITQKKFYYRLSRAAYQKDWGSDYRRPSFLTRLLAFIIRIVPKIGPFRALTFRTPTPATEALFVQSFEVASQDFDKYIHEDHDAGKISLVNDNIDVGAVTGPGQYPLADVTYANLMDRLAKNKFADVTPALRSNLLDFFKDSNAPNDVKKKKKRWRKLQAELEQLRAAQLAATE
ncbi:MAG TPA: zinc dependent phospholipase C family protein [Candidatus Acidoferrales bacterium]|nr:zinc dependent phospholipase C family protein [Candidatus Acidoferrales bacterium]